MATHEIARTRIVVSPTSGLPQCEITSQPQWETSVEPDGPSQVAVTMRAPAWLLDTASAATIAGELCENQWQEDPLQYADYAGWQADLVDDKTLNGHALWSSQPPAVAKSLPWGEPGSAQPARRRLPVEVDPSCRAFLERDDPRPTLAAVLAAVLHQHIGGWPTIGVVTDGRHYPELTDAIGPYARLLDVTVNLNDLTWVQADTMVADKIAELEEWQEFQPGRTTIPTASVQVRNFSDIPPNTCIQQASSEPWTGLHLELTLGGTSKQHLDLVCSTSEYADSTTRELVSQITAALSDRLDQPANSPATTQLVNRTTARQQSRHDHGPRRTRARQLLHEGFQRICDEHASKVALLTTQHTLTYRELDQLATGLAHRIQASDPTRAPRIMINHPDPAVAVVSMIAALRLGGCFIPVDPQWPADRIAAVRHAVSPDVEVTPRGATTTTNDATIEIVDLDAIEQSSDRIHAEPTGSDLAYVIFTSGSTGQPKGVMIQHSAAANTIEDVNGRVQLSPDDLVFSASALTFDLAIYDIFGPLSVGGSTLLLTRDERYSPGTWLDTVRQHEPTIWDSVPTVYSALLDRADPGDLNSLRQVLLSGDVIPASLLTRSRNLLPHTRIEVMGGATEASIWSIGMDAESIPDYWRAVPYGKAMENQSIHVLDDDLTIAATGVAGDIAIAGDGVALGYANQPGLTASRFVADPYSDQAGATMYLTGDRGRRWADGTIQFLGRDDDQVQIRGYRVEPGEVTTVLQKLPGVTNAVTVVRRTAGGAQLAAYYSGDRDREGTHIDQLREQLPEYLHPSSVTYVSAMPLTENGKVAVDQLPEPGAAPYVAPANEIEKYLAGLWAELLQVDRVGRDDDFFALGGHSLMLAEIVTRIQSDLDVSLDLRQFFEAVTLQKAADQILLSYATTDGDTIHE